MYTVINHFIVHFGCFNKNVHYKDHFSHPHSQVHIIDNFINLFPQNHSLSRKLSYNPVLGTIV